MGKSEEVLSYLISTYPNAKCALHFSNDYECLVAIVLSAQTTDKSVNKVTPTLFSHFPNVASLMHAKIEDLENDIKSLGLYKNKAKSLQKLGEYVYLRTNGVIPHDKETLLKIPGVGEKTARVFLLERANAPFIPVDTHLSRIAKRLGYAKENDSPLLIERKLEKNFPIEKWGFLHHAFIEFGRNQCTARNPCCSNCPLSKYCRYFKKNSSTTGK